MKSSVFIAAFVLYFLMATCIVFAENSTDNNVDKLISVEAEGSGATKMEALQSAWMEAVRKGVGMYMSSKTEAVDEKLTEQVVMHSRGQVNSYSVISEDKENGIWNVKIKANIDKDILQETAEATETKKLKLDGKDLAANLDTREKKVESQKAALKEVLDLLDASKIFDHVASIEQSTDKNDKSFYYVKHVFTLNIDKWKQQADVVESILARTCTRMEKVKLNINAAKEMLMKIKDPGLPKKLDFDYLWSIPLTDPSRIISNRQPDCSFCVFNSISFANCYIFDKDAYKDAYRRNGYSIKFVAKYGTGFDVTEVESKKQEFYYSGWNTASLVFPFCGVGGASYFARIGYNQKLDLSPEQLLKTDEIVTSYTITRD